MTEETYPKLDLHKTLESLRNELEETKMNLTVLSTNLDQRDIDKHYAEALKSFCSNGLLGLTLMMVAGLLTSFLFTMLVYADSHVWIYLSKRSVFLCNVHYFIIKLFTVRSILYGDKSETAPLFPTNTQSTNVSPTALSQAGAINRTLLHHQQLHGLNENEGGALISNRNSSVVSKIGFVYLNTIQHDISCQSYKAVIYYKSL